MNRKELKTASDSDVIMDYIESYAYFTVNLNTHGGTKAIGRHLKDLDDEMLRRGILTQKQIDRLNS